MIKFRNAVDFTRGIWLMAQAGASGKEVKGECLNLLDQRECSIPNDSPLYTVRKTEYCSRQYFEWQGKVYSGLYAQLRRLGLLSSVVEALVSTGAESNERMKRRFALSNLASTSQGWGWNEPPVTTRYDNNFGLGLPSDYFRIDSYRHWDLVEGRYDVSHPYLRSSGRKKIWPSDDKPDLWRSLWLLMHCSGQEQNGLKAYKQLLLSKGKVIELGLAPAVAQNYCESLISPKDDLRKDPLGLHETARFCGLYAALRLAYPELTRLQAEEALSYPSQGFVNHWTIARTLSQLEDDWLI